MEGLHTANRTVFSYCLFVGVCVCLSMSMVFVVCLWCLSFVGVSVCLSVSMFECLGMHTFAVPHMWRLEDCY